MIKNLVRIGLGNICINTPRILPNRMIKAVTVSRQLEFIEIAINQAQPVFDKNELLSLISNAFL